MKKGYLIISVCPATDVELLTLKAQPATNALAIESAYLHAQSVVYLTDTYKKAQRKAAIRTLRENGYGHVVGLYLAPNVHHTQQSKTLETELLLSKPPSHEEGFDELFLIDKEYQLIPHD
jgi:hypothetical protein